MIIRQMPKFSEASVQPVYKVGLSESNFVARGIEFKEVKPNYYYIEAEGIVNGRACRIFGNVEKSDLARMTKGTKENTAYIESMRKEVETLKREFKKTQDYYTKEQIASLEDKIVNSLYITQVTVKEPRYTYAAIFVKHAKKLKHGISLKRAQRFLERGNWRKLNKLLKKDVKFIDEKYKSYKRL